METFENNPYWRPSYAEEISTLLQKIPRMYETAKNFCDDPGNANFIRGFMKMHRERFATEFNRRRNFRNTERLMIRRANVAATLERVFGNSLCATGIQFELNVDLAVSLIEEVGKDLLPNCANFRENGARPSGYGYHYADPIDIERSLRKLFDEFSRPLETGNEFWYKKASNFYRRFLKIHPFRNGNGRLARILLSILLVNYTVIPICLFSWTINSNELHLAVLDEAHQYDNENLLCSLIIESVYNSLDAFINCMEIEDL